MTDIIVTMENIYAQSLGSIEPRTLKPETFRLPKPGERDPYFGLPRTTCPAPDEGVHKWVYYAARSLVEPGYLDKDLPKVEAAFARYDVREVGRL